MACMRHSASMNSTTSFRFVWQRSVHHCSLFSIFDFISLSIDTGRCLWYYAGFATEIMYRKTSNISRTLVGNKNVDHRDVVGASPVGAAPTTSSRIRQRQPQDSTRIFGAPYIRELTVVDLGSACNSSDPWTSIICHMLLIWPHSSFKYFWRSLKHIIIDYIDVILKNYPWHVQIYNTWSYIISLRGLCKAICFIHKGHVEQTEACVMSQRIRIDNVVKWALVCL